MIHYHGGPVTPITAGLALWDRRHAMVSFAVPDQLELAAEICQSFTLDNGAFSAWKQGTVPDWPAYAAWVRKWYRHPGFDWCVIPDVVEGSPAENDELLNWWDALGFPPGVGVPVWHLHEPTDRLVGLAQDYTRICLGSSGDFATPGTDAWWQRMAEAMDVFCEDGAPRAKLHGLRMLDPAIFSRLPLASADSTNVAQNIGYDGRWTGPYSPASKATRAMVIADRIEAHTSAATWERTFAVQEGLAL